ncbi:Vacuolar protein-sorting-associated protein 27, partial [Coemansia aciculifera]
MVARLFYGSPIDDDVNKLTAEDVPNHELDMSAALNFADKIRSKEYSAKEVARVLRKRLDSSNPNVQILVLSLADICVKNGGSLVQLEISAREFIDEVTNLLESKTGRDFELRQLVLRLIQEWAALFQGNNEMGYANGVLERMKRTGYTFPKLAMVASGAMTDTASAPEWEESPVCQRCRTAFTFTNRKHHCRHCGKCYCNDCSSNNTPIPKFAIYDPVRVCHGCYLRLKKIDSDSESLPSLPSAMYAQTSSARPAAVSSATATYAAPNVNDDDEDLKRAIELSLQESQARPNYADYTLPT